MERLKEREMSFICSFCNREFNRKSNLKHHILRIHLKIKNSVNVASCEFICSVCGRKFNRKFNLKCHLLKLHPNSNSCDENVSFLSFPSMKEFEEWKENEEVRTLSRYVQRKGATSNRSEKRINFYCNRSGDYVAEKKKQKRALKISGSQKIDYLCPAFMKIKIDKLNGSVRVEYNQNHFKHEKEFRFQRVPKKIENYIIAKLEEGVPVRTIVKQWKDDYDNYDDIVVQKDHLITRHHVYNICRRHGLLHLYRRHNVGAVGVSLLAKELGKNLHSPVLFYKEQFVDQPPLRNDDLMLIIMSESQREALQSFGHKSILIDSTHGTNSYAFNLTTLVVIDEFGEGYPAAFCISSRVDEVSMKLFFEKIKEAVGIIKPEVFMSDDFPSYYNAWKAINEQSTFHLLCKWHVIQNWKKNLDKLQEAVKEKDTKEKQKSKKNTRLYVMKNLYVLIDATNENEFLALLEGFLIKLDENNLQEFKNYFVSNYLPRKEMWAACYRKGVMINTNIALEAFHEVLKHNYLEGKKNKRVDTLVSVLLKMIRDKNFERLIKLHNHDKLTHYVNQINSNHRKAVLLKNENKIKMVEIDDNTWSVESETVRDKGHRVVKCEVENDRCCQVLCIECKMCMHAYTCTCHNYQIDLNVCKHIHFVHLSLKNMMNFVINTITDDRNVNDVEIEEIGIVEIIQDTIVEQIPIETSLENTSLLESLLDTYKIICKKLATEKFDDTTLQKCHANANEVINLLNKNNTGGVNREPVNKKADNDNQLRFMLKKPDKENFALLTFNPKNQGQFNGYEYTNHY